MVVDLNIWNDSVLYPVLLDTLVVIVELHVLIRYLDSFVLLNVTAVNQNVITCTVVNEMVSL